MKPSGLYVDRAALNEILAALARHGGDGILEELKPIIQTSAKEIRSIGRQNRRASEKTGRMRKAIKIGRFRRVKNRLIHAAVGLAIADSYQDPDGKVYRPYKVAHFIERGFKHRLAGPIEADPYLQPAWDQVAPQTLDSIIRKTQAVLGL